MPAEHPTDDTRNAAQRQLAFTGADLPLITLLGGAALAAGALLRRKNGLLVR